MQYPARLRLSGNDTANLMYKADLNPLPSGLSIFDGLGFCRSLARLFARN